MPEILEATIVDRWRQDEPRSSKDPTPNDVPTYLVKRAKLRLTDRLSILLTLIVSVLLITWFHDVFSSLSLACAQQLKAWLLDEAAKARLLDETAFEDLLGLILELFDDS